MTSPTILVSLDRDLVERLCPGAIEQAHILAAGFSATEQQDWIAGRLGLLVSQRLEEIRSEALERRDALLALLDQVAAEPS